ncbi:MAG: YIP1 family protein, partial [Halobacteria archaeon]|nr:YIP1 family protein [Halobacteria archaeon]
SGAGSGSGTGAGAMSGVGALISVFGAVAALVGTFVVWVVYAVVFYVISLFFDGEGEFKDTLLLSGWGFLPTIFSSLIGGIALYIALQNMAVPQNPQQFVTVTQQVQNQPVVRVSSLLGIVFT